MKTSPSYWVRQLICAVCFAALFSACDSGSSGSSDSNNNNTNYGWIEGYPSTSVTSETGFDVSLQTTVSGTAYYVVLENGKTGPDLAKLKYGLDGNGSDEVSASGNAPVSANTETTISISLSEGNALYTLYVAVVNDNTNDTTDIAVLDIEVGIIAPSSADMALEQEFSGTRYYWNDNSSNEDGFIIQRSTTEDFTEYTEITVDNQNTTSYTDTGFTPDCFNYYRVASYRVIGSEKIISGFSEASSRYCVDTDFEYDFTFVFLPDTQFYCDYENLNEIFYSQCTWIVDNSNSQKLLFTGGLGDVVDDWADNDEWLVAQKAFGILEDGDAPYGSCRGNHDSPDSYISLFPASRWEGKSYYGGHSDNQLNSYFIVEADGQKFMFLFIDYSTGYVDTTWIQQVLDANNTVPTLLITHEFLGISENNDIPSDLSIMSGQEWVWNDIAYSNPQIFMVLCGHNHGSGYTTMTNEAGRQVIAVLADYQMGHRQGNGWLRLLRFNLDEGIIQGITYSPYVSSLARSERTEGEDEAFLTHSSYYGDHQHKIEFDVKGLVNYLNQ